MDVTGEFHHLSATILNYSKTWSLLNEVMTLAFYYIRSIPRRINRSWSLHCIFIGWHVSTYLISANYLTFCIIFTRLGVAFRERLGSVTDSVVPGVCSGG